MNNEEALRIIVESMPSASLSWIDILAALLTPTIALIALYIAYQQYKINQQRLRHETYERRLRVYKAVQAHLSIILRAGKTSYQECTLFYSEASEAAFLFDNSVMDKIDEIYRKSIDMVGLHEQLYPSDGSAGLPVGEQRSKVSHKNSELLKWHIAQLVETKKFFAKRIGIKTT